MRAFVTVGSTRFDALVQQALSNPVLNVLRSKGYTSLVVQCGESVFDSSQVGEEEGGGWVRHLEGVGTIEVWRFKPTLQDEYKQADLVISHAGVNP